MIPSRRRPKTIPCTEAPVMPDETRDLILSSTTKRYVLLETVLCGEIFTYWTLFLRNGDDLKCMTCSAFENIASERYEKRKAVYIFDELEWDEEEMFGSLPTVEHVVEHAEALEDDFRIVAESDDSSEMMRCMLGL